MINEDDIAELFSCAHRTLGIAENYKEEIGPAGYDALCAAVRATMKDATEIKRRSEIVEKRNCCDVAHAFPKCLSKRGKDCHFLKTDADGSTPMDEKLSTHYCLFRSFFGTCASLEAIRDAIGAEKGRTE